MRYPLAVVLFLFIGLISTSAQNYSGENLVTNPSFEDWNTTQTVEKSSAVESCKSWNSPNKSTPQIFTTTASGSIYDSYGSAWSFNARTGKNVAGLKVHGNDSENRDYIQGTLTKALEVGKKYYFSFWVHYHCSGANNIGIAFLPNPIKSKEEGLLELKPATYQAELTPYDKKNTWTLVRDSFIAYKPYESFVIGNFFNDGATKLEGSNYGHYFAYIDDILVVEAKEQELSTSEDSEAKEDWAYNEAIAKEKPAEEKAPVEEVTVETAPIPEPAPEKTDVFTEKTPVNLNNITFDQASSNLSKSSYFTLDALAQLLAENPSQRVIVKGFASSEGSDRFNRTLSMERAQIVVDYLLEKGVNLSSVMVQAFGEANPVAPNDTEANRRKNRRVELELLN